MVTNKMLTPPIVLATAELINATAIGILRDGLQATEEAFKASGAFCYEEWLYIRDRALLLTN